MACPCLEELHWLLPAPPDFRALAKALATADDVNGATLMALATHALDINKLTQLDRVITNLPAAQLDAGPLSPVRLAVLAEATTDYIAPAIRASALRHGILAELYVPDFGQATQEVLGRAESLEAFGADMALIAQNHVSLGLANVYMDEAAAEAAVARALAQIKAMLGGLRQMQVGTVIVQTVPVPPDPWCGHFDRSTPGSVAAQIAAFNEGLTALARAHSATLLDIAALADQVGRARWFDHALWHRAKLPFALECVPLYADHVGRMLATLRGKARKCLVLDLDNTCWGGVIGDDGLEGIQIGQGSAEGEAHLALQTYALQLKARGIVLAVCSKNEEDAARLPFREHPDMALREDDIAVFIANWTDKATNIRHIARLLNIGTDALVFCDDNPAERARVRQMLPEVAVPELPDDAAFYATALAQGGYFETVGLSADDAKRAAQYQDNAKRSLEMEAFGDYGDYLASLDMICDLRPFDTVGRMRIAQLVNKSNQFNLTTRRYTEAEIRDFETDPDKFTLQVRLTDKFGDNGMISVIIFDKGADEWVCDTWLMSCRVIGRRVEEAVLAVVAEAARHAGVDRLVGAYLPTAKNGMVEGHFAKLGFTQHSEGADGGTIWHLDLADYAAPDLPMELKVPALAPTA
ncbi:MAG: HAD-IIIC family phosphatase [Pseudomonadota bacterium]